MKPLLKLARAIDRLTAGIGKAVSWLALGAVAVTFTVVVLRYGFAFGRIWIQESYLWMHAAVFMLGAAWTLQEEGHVRVDIFYRKFSPRRRCWADLLGALLLLLPSCALVIWFSMPYVIDSWRLLEGSREAGGIPAIFTLKTIIPATAALLALQGLSIAIHNAARLVGAEAMPSGGADIRNRGYGE